MTDQELSEWAQRQAASFVEQMRSTTPFPWEFTDTSIALLDLVIDEYWPDGPSEDTLAYTAVVMAAYVGEVIVRNLNGRWHYDNTFGPVVIANGLAISTMSRVQKRFRRGSDYSLAQFYTELRDFFATGASEMPSAWRRWSSDERREWLRTHEPPGTEPT